VTRAMELDPLGGDPSKLFYNKILKELMTEGFHPGKKLNILTDTKVGVLAPDNIRVEKNLPPLTEELWKRLQPIGELRIEPISFARGTERINLQSKRSLDELSERLKSWPRAYMRIIGNTRPEGDLTANKILAYKRANAVQEYLLSKGIQGNRIRAEASEDIGKEGGTQTVSFILGYVPY
jgi:outer membrane protein OmpA-like peptidoglycan-associated protein